MVGHVVVGHGVIGHEVMGHRLSDIGIMAAMGMNWGDSISIIPVEVVRNFRSVL